MRRWIGSSLLTGFLLVTLFFFGCGKKEAAPQPAATAVTAAPGDGTLDLKVTPDHPRMVAPVTFTVHVADSAGKPVDGAQVTGSLSMALMDMGKTGVKFESKGKGDYVGTLKNLDMAGPWELSVEATQDGFHAQKKFGIVIYD